MWQRALNLLVEIVTYPIALLIMAAVTPIVGVALHITALLAVWALYLRGNPWWLCLPILVANVVGLILSHTLVIKVRDTRR